MLEQVKSLWHEYNDDILSFIIKIILSVVVIVIGIIISKGFNRILKKAETENKNKFDKHASSIVSKIVKYSLFIICVIMILNIFGINTTSLLAVLGAAGLAVGLALKNTLGNIASGIILLFLGTYRNGEFIEFGAVKGTVKDISLFTTILETSDGVYVSAPNSCIWGVPLKNYTRNGKRKMEIPVRLSCEYSTDIAIQILKEITASEKRFLQTPSPEINVQSVADKTASLVIQAWADNNEFDDIYHQMMINIKEKMEEAGILI